MSQQRRELDSVKTRMSAAHDTLKEAASLGSMFASIDEVRHALTTPESLPGP